MTFFLASEQAEIQRQLDGGEGGGDKPQGPDDANVGAKLAGIFGKKGGGDALFSAARLGKMLMGAPAVDMNAPVDPDSEWHPLVAKRDASISEGEELLQSVGAGDASVAAFVQQHQTALKPVADGLIRQDVFELEQAISTLRACVERLRKRFEEEDGLYLSIKVGDLPTAPHISPHLPTSPHISPQSSPPFDGLRSPFLSRVPPALANPGDDEEAQMVRQPPRGLPRRF